MSPAETTPETPSTTERSIEEGGYHEDERGPGIWDIHEVHERLRRNFNVLGQMYMANVAVCCCCVVILLIVIAVLIYRGFCVF